MKNYSQAGWLLFAACCAAVATFAQNPIIRNQYSADPSARVFGEKLYLFASHDILAREGKGRVGWFCMEDYHVFSSANLTDWTDNGIVVTQNKIDWVKPDSYSMWAPDCIERNGKYYFYFPTSPKDSIAYGRGFAIGVAMADKPEGPYTAAPLPIAGVHGIDPNVFINKDGQAYLYWSAGNIYCAKLKANMLELAAEVKTLGELPAKGLKEGPFVFERNGTYYLTYPHVENKIERLEYAIADNPLGPFKITGVIMDEAENNCWTNHHSITQFKNQWYLFYHNQDYSPGFDKARSVRADSLTFNTDGTIKKVIPTLRGIGITNATTPIQVDRYTQTSGKAVSIDFIDTLDHFKGWKTTFNEANAWIQYNSVDFANGVRTVVVNTRAPTGGILEIRTGGLTGTVVAKVSIPSCADWKTISMPVAKSVKGIENLFVLLKGNHPVQLDWLHFK